MTAAEQNNRAAEASSAYENPLIPNARLRQIYLTMARMRMLEKRLPAGRRARALALGGRGHAVGAVGMEACLASTSVDLLPGDLVSDALTGGMLEFLRGASLGKTVSGGKKPGKGKGTLAGCGSAAEIPAGPGISERLWSAAGAAAAVKAQAVQAKIETEAETSESVDEPAAPQAGVVVVYVRPGEVASALWRKVLGFAAERELPILFVVMPAARGANPGKAGGVSGLALSCGVPGIAVDGDDAVAIYRVAQESIGRARAGGGAALMECMPFVLHGGARKARPAEDAIAGMERYLLGRSVVKKAWIKREAQAFARKLAGTASSS